MMLNVNKHELALLKQALTAWRNNTDPENCKVNSPSHGQWYAAKLVCLEIDAMLARLKSLEGAA
jgi:hypothetical protein